MLVNKTNVGLIFSGLKKNFQDALIATAGTDFEKVCTVVPSETETEQYPWLQDDNDMREWIGDRVVADYSAHTYSLRNRQFEKTNALKVTSIEDNTFASQAVLAQQAAYIAKTKPDRLVFGELLPNAFDAVKGKCYDGGAFIRALLSNVGLNGLSESFPRGLGPLSSFKRALCKRAAFSAAWSRVSGRFQPIG